jgi:aryl-alcohol dehydrogenase-like predicted oxidoreductase
MGFDKRRPFGSTGRTVCPIGISSSFGLDAGGVEEAVDNGVNYIFFGSIRKESFGEGIRRVAGKKREDLIIVLQTYFRSVLGRLQVWDMERGLRSLGLEYVDVMLMGWFNALPSGRLIERALKLKEQGKVRMLALSTHKRASIPEIAGSRIFDIFHVRYNAAHRGAEKDVFPYLDPVTGPGLVAFTATRWGSLLDPKKMPPGEKPLRASDAYRFCLSDLHIHTVATGPGNREQLREALLALEKGPLEPDEMARAKRIGDFVYRRKHLMARE